MKSRTGARFPIVITTLIVVTAALYILSFGIGKYPVEPLTVLRIFLNKLPFINITPDWDDTIDTVVMQVRFPRIILAILTGGALSVSGASYQTLFKNPMVSPDILGVSAGAGFGAALAMLYNLPWWQIQIFAFVCGLTAVIAAYVMAYVFGRRTITILVLAGVVTSSLFQALLSIVKTLADTDNALPAITFWLMGGLGRGVNRDVVFMLPAMGISMAALFLFRTRINALAAGEDEAATMGVNVNLVKVVVIGASTLMTVCTVAVCGIIGWVGMIVPHIARMIVGADYSRLSFASFFIGGSFLLVIDDIIRGCDAVNLPLGVLTALVGTPVFAFLLSRVKKGWQ